jgi:hypothetical protein
MARQLYDTLSPIVLGSFQCAKLMLSVLVEACGVVDVVSVGLITVAKEEKILKRRRKR